MGSDPELAAGAECCDRALHVPLTYKAALRDLGAVQIPAAGLVIQRLSDAGEHQPLAAPINAVRESLMTEYEPQLMTWLACAFWAVVLAGGGLVFFWRGEGRYGAK